MPKHATPCIPAPCRPPALKATISNQLTSALALALTAAPDAMETAAQFGRWWLDPETAQLALSAGAAALLDVDAGLHSSPESCFTQVAPGDLLLLLAAINEASARNTAIDCTFRVVHAMEGLHWIRMRSLTPAFPNTTLHSGVLTDITAAKNIEMRERFSFEVTQYLVGTHNVGTAVTKVIQLVCENLGWEWGAYWSLERDDNGAHTLACRHNWHNPDFQFDTLTRESGAIRMAPGEGLVGHVWSTGQAAWFENLQKDPAFLRRKSAHDCRLRSGYAFPVAYMSEDGQRHSPGVLEFFSTLSRQQEAQLPNLSAAIGALIAQTVQRLEQQEHVLRLSQIDDLTGLANRHHFHQLLDQACFDAAKNDGQFGLLYVDLDHFKPVNDAFGHDAGNAVLSEFSRRLQKFAADGCHVGRLGGDEFIILKPLAAATDAALPLQTLAEQVLLAARTPIFFEGTGLTVSASIGISIFPANGGTSAALLRSADAAMYRSKKNGRNDCSFFFNHEMPALAQQQSSLAQQLTIEAELQRAVAGDEFFLEYQPVFDNYSQKMVAVEALIRWRHPSGDIVRPDLFMPIAENSRLIVQIGRWVVQHACRDLAVLHASGFPDLKVHVNMAAIEFTNTSLPYELTAVIEAHHLAARHLCLELTEGTVMQHPDKVIPVMQMLRQLGFEISLDDFGMGHSSLSRVKSLPVTSVKIDRSFVSGLPHDRGDGAIVRTILDLGRHMKLQVIAEGVETDAQFAFLDQFGCTLLQGYLFSRPVSLAALLAAQHQLRQA